MRAVMLGVVTLGGPGAAGLAEAAERHPDAVVRHVHADEDGPVPGVAGLIIDVPAANRGAVAVRLARRWRVPVLLEAPVALTPAEVREALRACDGVRVFSANPLDHHLPTRRLREQITAAADPVEQIFGVWRFRHGAFHGEAVAQLIDYLGHLAGSRPARITAMRREKPTVLLATLRYENNVVASVEMGDHLPAGLPRPSELLVECFCRETVYHCAPDSQAVTVDGRRRMSTDWSAPASDHIVSMFVEALADGRAPERSLDRDLETLDLCQQVYGR